MFRLRYVIVLMTNAVLVGTLLIVALSLGWVGWLPVFGAVALGFALSWPAARLVSRRIKTDDPGWNENAERPVADERRRRDLRSQGLSPTDANAAARAESRR